MTLSTGLDARELRLRASLLAHYELPWLGVDQEDGVLFPDSRRVRVESGLRHWSLDDSVRRSVVAGVRFSELQRVWSELVERPGDPRQWAIDQFVGMDEGEGKAKGKRKGVDLDKLDVDQLRAVGWLSRWLDLPHVPSRTEIDRKLGLAALLEPLRALADHTFVGREDLLSRLDEHLRLPGQPLLIHGMGGVGKSAVLARHVLGQVRSALVCYLNFDNSALDPAVPATLIAAIARQLALQLPEDNTEMTELFQQAEEQLRSGTRLHDSSSRTLDLRLRDRLEHLSFFGITRDRQILFVFDTLEEVQRRSSAVQETFADFLGKLLGPYTSIVLAGRSPAPRFRCDSVELSVLPIGEAITLLRSLVDVPEDEARNVLELIRTTPLCVRLAAGILRKHPVNDAFRDLALRRTAIEGELYHRLLGYIADPEVRRLAHPGLTLRRMTPELIEKVLAKPCRIAVPDERRAHRLFDELAREAMLVDRVPDRNEVVHRADVRSIMLPRLTEDDPATIASIHRRAVRFYARREDVTDRAEELYHRLMLGQSPATLDRRWDDRTLPHLVSSLDELPPSSKAYLAAKSPHLAVSEDDLRQAELDVQSKLILRRVREFAANRRFAQALTTLGEHDEIAGASAESTDLRIQLLDLLGQRDDALDVAANAQEEAARTGDTEEFFRLTAHILRLCELAGRLDDADTVATGALQISVNLPPTTPYLQRQLQLVVQRLRFARRGALVSDATADLLRHQAIHLYDQLGVRGVREVPGLLRELGAEVGQQSLPVLVEALLSEGIDPRDAGQVLGSLAELRGTTEELPADIGQAKHRYMLAAQVAQALVSADEVPEHISRLLTELLQQEADDATAGGTDSEYTETSVDEPVLLEPNPGDALVATGIEAAAAGDSERAELLLREALGTDLDDDTRARALVALAGVVSDEAESRSMLEVAGEIAQTAASRALYEARQARLALILGNTRSALAHYDSAVATMTHDTAHIDSVLLADVLLDRGAVLITLGKLGDAETDFSRVAELMGDRDDERAAQAHWRLGRIAALRSDLPAAVAHYRKAPRLVPAVLSRAEALMAAGLAADAAAVLEPLRFALRDAQDGQSLAVAEQRGAAAAFLCGDFAGAAELARSANRRFTRRNEDRWAAISALTRMRAQLAMGKPPAARRVADLAEQLRDLGLTDEAAVAAALSVRVSLHNGELVSAVDLAYSLPGIGHHSPIECRMALRLCRAELAAARGDHQRVLVLAERGFAELADHTDRLGTLDLPTGTAVEGRALADLAVTNAWRSSSPDVFDWLERTKADIYRCDPAPVPDSVSEPRIAARRRQEARLEGRAVEGGEAEPSEELRAVPATSLLCSREEVAAQLGDRVLVSFGVVEDQFAAMVMTAESSFYAMLGPLGHISTLVHELVALEPITHGPYTRTAGQLDRLLFGPFDGLSESRELIVLPARGLHNVPWGFLPSLRGRPVTVAPSATTWLRAEQSARSAGKARYVATARDAHLRVPRAGLELIGDEVTVEATLSALDGAPLVHLATTVTGGDGNSWFAAAELADGPLTASAIRALSRPPTVVVLVTPEPPANKASVGSDVFGFAGALLNAGVRTVVTAVGTVTDNDSRHVFNAFYPDLLHGRTVAQALARATAKHPLRMPFICLGADGAVELT
jgi:tetratricopeptide (TPR) repeat protein